MKTWTMPRVHVEAFFANEYVSVCKGTKPLPTSGMFAADIFHYRNDNYGTPDGLYNGSSYEMFLDGKNPKGLSNGAYNTGGMWFTNVQFYRITGNSSPQMSYADNPNVFAKYDVYDIYVSKVGLTTWAYPAGTHTDNPDYDPETKPYS